MHSNTHYVVLYNVPDDERRARFEEGLRKLYNWWHFTPSAMIICTSQSPDLVQQTLLGWIDAKTDKFVAVQLQQNGARPGLLDQVGWDWLTEHLGTSRWFR